MKPCPWLQPRALLSVPNPGEGKTGLIRTLGNVSSSQPVSKGRLGFPPPPSLCLMALGKPLPLFNLHFLLDHRESFLKPGGEFCV